MSFFLFSCLFLAKILLADNKRGDFLFLRRLDISGFKSFAAKSVLDFEKGENVTAIVGPNGSGKSNIADSIRWVLGETSYKTVRAKKSEDVIFSGSNGKAKASFARVSMQLDNTDGKAPIDFSEVEISRSVYRDGSSEYMINGRKSRLLDVAELLAKSGFGQSTYSVIGQGMVDSMLFYGPAERKVLFDEAAGVRAYEIKREQTIKKLEDTAQNLIRINDILSELTPRLKALKRQAEKAKEKDTVKGELLEAQKTYFASIWDRLSVSEKEKRAELEKILAEEEKIKAEMAELNDKFNNALGQEKKDFKGNGKLEQRIQELELKKNEVMEEIYTLRAQIAISSSTGTHTKEELAEKIRALEDELNNLTVSKFEKQKNEYEKKIRKAEAEMAEAVRGIEAKKTELAVLSEELSQFDFGAIGESLSGILKSQKDFIGKLSKAKDMGEIETIIAFGKKVAERIDELSTKIGGAKEGQVSGMAELQSQIEELTVIREEKNKERNELQSGLIQVSFDVKRVQERRQELKEQIADLRKIQPVDKGEKEELEARIVEAEKEANALEDEIRKGKREIASGSADFLDQGKALTEIKDALAGKQSLLTEYGTESTNLKVELAKFDTKKQDLKEEIGREIGSEAVLADAKVVPELDEGTAREEIEKLKTKLYAIGEIDPEVETEFTEVNARVEFLSTQTTDLENAKNDLEKLVNDLDGKIKKQFETAFSAISDKFAHFFTLLFDGGTAKLELTRIKNEEEDTEEFGIEITAVPPGKRVQSLSALSGGERTMTSLALLFAILSVNPAPFVVLDEVDAALDEPNTKKFLKIISELAHSTQFIFITHNRETMKTAHMIYGITMDETHDSKLLSIKLEDAVAVSGKSKKK
jgi:chromosome segregation ATPase